MSSPVPRLALCGVLASLAIVLAAPLAAQMSELPAELRGTWAAEPEHCTDPSSDGRVEVTAHSVAFYAAEYEVRSVRRDGSGWTAEAEVHEEGEEGTQPGRVTLRPLGADTLEIATHIGVVHQLVRCTAAPAR